MTAILVTGAGGFVGRAVTSAALARGWDVAAVVRDPAAAPAGTRIITVGDLAAASPPNEAFSDCAAVIHCAGLAHRPDASASDLARMNVGATALLAERMRNAGVRRLVLVSSIGACATRSRSDRPLRPTDVPRPEGAYGRSKLAAEEALLTAHRAGWLDPLIVRPPLVYGPGAPGNLARLVAAIARGAWLPLAAIDNRRSLVGVDDLAQALLAAVTSGVPGRRYHVSGDDVISTPGMIAAIASGLGNSARLGAVPPWALLAAGACCGRLGQVRKLVDDLEIDASAFIADTGWRSTCTSAEGLRAVGAASRGVSP
ncbi:MAG: NAD-dependent epimerase/dehydratase family protein [Planctomycetes bacterium]|nr:NAD-dependent epimerase/dehydratase family protein [Planctomycetota bacterium]